MTQKSMPQFLIAAPMSGSGKTTVSRGLMALLRSKGYVVQPFKCGPDYIDTKFHEAVCGRPSINLDTFMASEQHVVQLYARYAAGVDACVVEGMMGLFDGYDRDLGSTAHVARVLNLPVVLVVDARSAAYSMAALLSGFLHFNKEMQIAGVIFNRVGSARHQDMLRQVCDDLRLSCYGMLPRCEQLEQGSRYLGLDFSQVDNAAGVLELMEQHIDWRRLLQDTLLPASLASEPQPPLPLRVCIARNAESFSFLYQETIDRFASVSFFDPETQLPQLEDTDLLYLPGGYPEKHVLELSLAADTRRAISDYARRGGRIVAECGGMMYLCRDILTDSAEGTVAFPLCGVLPYSITACRNDRRLSLGYRRFMAGGREYRGHEFHYSQFLGTPPPTAFTVTDAPGNLVGTPVIRQGNVLASYTHLYWGEQDILKIFSET